MNEERWPSGVYRSGANPDPRFSLANERTFLAWIRTAVGVLACSVAVGSIGTTGNEAFDVFIAALLALISLVCCGHAWQRWCRWELAMRLGGPFTAGPMLALVAALLFIAGLASLVGVVVKTI